MKKIFTAAAVAAAFAATGCGAQQAPSAGVSEAPVEPASRHETCQQMFTNGQNSKFYKTIDFYTNVTDASDSNTAKEISADLAPVTKYANAQLKPHLQTFSKAADEIAASASGVDVGGEDFKAAGHALIELCDTEVEEGSTPTPTPTTTPTTTPTPTRASVKTSGNYGADLAAIGVVPDAIDSYTKFMTKNMCETPLSVPGIGNSFPLVVKQMGKPGSESSGSGPGVVRLTVAYFCPERAVVAEEELKRLGYDK